MKTWHVLNERGALAQDLGSHRNIPGLPRYRDSEKVGALWVSAKTRPTRQEHQKREQSAEHRSEPQQRAFLRTRDTCGSTGKGPAVTGGESPASGSEGSCGPE